MVLHKNESIAVHGGHRLGDTLLALVFAHNLIENGYKVTFFSTILDELKPLFPKITLDSSLPPWSAQKEKEMPHPKLAPFNLILFPASSHFLVHKNPEQEKKLWDRGPKVFYERISLPTVFQNVCKTIFCLDNTFRTNGMIPPKGAQAKKFPRRVVIHPTSSDLRKNWQKKKFFQLAEALKKKGFEPYFTLASYERKDWENSTIPLVPKGNMLELAHFIYESGYFIGNDSGIGHLASNLGLPTLTFCPRKTQGKRWGPAWSESELLYPWLHLPGPRLKLYFWKHFISVKTALKGFDKILIQSPTSEII